MQQHKLMVNLETCGGGWRRLLFGILVKANAKSVSWIKRRKLSLKAKSQVKLSACHFAAFGARADAMPLLVEQGMSCCDVAPTGATALHFAALGNNLETLKWLCANLSIIIRGTDGSMRHIGVISSKTKNDTELEMTTASFIRIAHFAAAAGSTRILDWFSSTFSSIVNCDVLDAKDETGCTVMHFAAEAGAISSCEFATFSSPKCQERIFSSTASGHTALHFAIAGGHLDMCQWLRARGLPLWLPLTSTAPNALHIAAEAGSVPVMQWLLAVCAREDSQRLSRAMSVPNMDGLMPHQIARNAGNMEIAHMLDAAASSAAAESYVSNAKNLLLQVRPRAALIMLLDLHRAIRQEALAILKSCEAVRASAAGNPKPRGGNPCGEIMELHERIVVAEKRLHPIPSFFEAIPPRRATMSKSQQRRQRRKRNAEMRAAKETAGVVARKLKKVASKALMKIRSTKSSSPESPPAESSSGSEALSDPLEVKSAKDSFFAVSALNRSRDSPRGFRAIAPTTPSPGTSISSDASSSEKRENGVMAARPRRQSAFSASSSATDSTLHKPVPRKSVRERSLSFSSLLSLDDSEYQLNRSARGESMEIMSCVSQFEENEHEWTFYSTKWAKLLIKMLTRSPSSPVDARGLWRHR